MECIIIGAGNYSYVLYNYLLDQKEPVTIVGFVDDNPALHGTSIMGIPVLGAVKALENLTQKARGVYCPIGNNEIRLRFLKYAESLGYELPNFIHRSSVVGPNVNLGKGVYVMPGTVVMPSATLQDYSMLSMCISVGHDTVLESGSFVANGCNIGGNIRIGAGTFVGMGATIISGVRSIGKGCIIGAGAVVIKDVPDYVTVVGNPGKIIKTRTP